MKETMEADLAVVEGGEQEHRRDSHERVRPQTCCCLLLLLLLLLWLLLLLLLLLHSERQSTTTPEQNVQGV